LGFRHSWNGQGILPKVSKRFNSKCDGHTVTVINVNDQHSLKNGFRGETGHAYGKCNYLHLPSPIRTPEDDKQRLSDGGDTPIPGLEPASGVPPSPSRPLSTPQFSPFTPPGMSRLRSDPSSTEMPPASARWSRDEGVYRPIPSSSMSQPRNIRSKTLPQIPSDIPLSRPSLLSSHSSSQPSHREDSRSSGVSADLSVYTLFKEVDIEKKKWTPVTPLVSHHVSKSASFPGPRPSNSSSSSAEADSSSTGHQNYEQMQETDVSVSVSSRSSQSRIF